MRTVTGAALGAALLLVLSASPALAGGSDAPTPYTVLPGGLQLPDGDSFPDAGHVNIAYTAGGVERAAGIHFDSLNGKASGAYIGASYLPWSVLVPEEDFCITWVQVGHYNEHFGEGGQTPVCSDGSVPPQTVVPPRPSEPAVPAKPVPAKPVPAKPVAESPAPATPVPGKPAPESSARPAAPGTSGESASPAEPSAPAVPDSAAPADPAGDADPEGSEPGASGTAGASRPVAALAGAAQTGPADSGVRSGALGDASAASWPGALGATGAAVAALVVVAGVLVLVGLLLRAARRRRGEAEVSASSSW
jgi:hypothetical protein